MKPELIGDIRSPEQQNRETRIQNKETEITPAAVEESGDIVHVSNCKNAENPDDIPKCTHAENSDASKCKPAEKSDASKCKPAENSDDIPKYKRAEKSDDASKCKRANGNPDGAVYYEGEDCVFEDEKPEGAQIGRDSKISVKNSGIKPAEIAFKFNLVASECLSPLAKTEPEVDDSNGKHKGEESIHDKEGPSKTSPKRRVRKAKECLKRISVLSAGSSCDGKDTGCFCTISPKRIYDLFKAMSPKCKSSSSRSTAFSPIGDGKHFEVVYLGQYEADEHERVERIDYTNMAEEKIIPTFLGSRPCYDVMPTSGKVVVFSVELLVKNAFSALVSNEIKAAPLWDAGIMDFVGMLTITDFINVLKYYYITKPEDMKDIENQSIATWRRMTGVPRKFVKINGQDSLAQAAKLLIQERIHRIPVFDEKRQCVLFVLTKKRLLQFLSQGLLEKFDKTNVRTPSFFKKTIRELKIGTFEDIAVVSKETKIIDALSIFVNRNVSALPVLNKDNILVDLFEKFDVFGLAKDQTYHNLEMTVDDVISKPYARETAWICTMDETLQTVITKFVTRKVHRLVVIDARRGVTGMISLSDVLKFLVVQPLGLMENATVSDTILEGSEGAVGGTDQEVDSPVEVDLASGVAHMRVTESSDDAAREEEGEPSADE